MVMTTVTSLNLRDLAWVAGVLDLKGVVIRKNNKQRRTPQLVLYVESKNYGVVRELSGLTGTAPEIQERQLKDWMRKGCAEHCPDAHVHVMENDYKWTMPAVARWSCSGAAAAVVLFNVLPFMRTDRGLEDSMNEMLDISATTGQGWGATKSALRRLRRLGWTLPPEYAKLDLDG